MGFLLAQFSVVLVQPSGGGIGGGGIGGGGGGGGGRGLVVVGLALTNRATKGYCNLNK